MRVVGDEASRICATCKVRKPIDAFAMNNAATTWIKRQYSCMDCGRRAKRIARGVHPDDAWMEPPPGQLCEICGSDGGKRGVFLDHDHDTGRFRGWLCWACNFGIGNLAHPDVLSAALAYLTRALSPGVDEPVEEAFGGSDT